MSRPTFEDRPRQLTRAEKLAVLKARRDRLARMKPTEDEGFRKALIRSIASLEAELA